MKSENSKASELLGVRVTPELKQKLQDIATVDGRNLSNLVIKILTDFIQLKEYEEQFNKQKSNFFK